MQAHIDEQNLTAETKIGLNGWVKAGEFCFSFGWQSRKFIETGDMNFSLVGGGPTLVDRRDGKIIPMANMGSMENYELRGDPYNGLSGVFHVTGSLKEGPRRDAFKFFRELTDKSIVECRDVIDSMMSGEIFIFDASALREPQILNHVLRFRELGLTVKRLTAFEAAAERRKDDQSSEGNT